MVDAEKKVSACLFKLKFDRQQGWESLLAFRNPRRVERETRNSNVQDMMRIRSDRSEMYNLERLECGRVLIEKAIRSE